MATYTTELRNYIENFSKHQHSRQAGIAIPLRDQIEIGRTHLFDFEYPLFDEDYKKVLETHFIRHYYMREIGFETFGQFKFKLESWMQLNMPYYNQLFESTLVEFDPLVNSAVDVSHTKKNDTQQEDTGKSDQSDKRTGTQRSDVTGNSDTTQQNKSVSEETADGRTTQNQTTESDEFNRSIKSDNPDSRLALTANDGEGVIEYASDITEQTDNDKETTKQDGTTHSEKTGSVTDNGSSKTNTNTHQDVNQEDDLTSNVQTQTQSKINEIEDYIQHRSGKIGTQSYSKLLQEYRASFLRIEQQMFAEMNDLFMLVY